MIPPRHRPDHTPVCILSFDDAWNTELIEYELGVLSGDIELDLARPPIPCETTADHPFERWVTGEARGDVETVQAYLTGVPTRFVLRQLGLRDWATVQDMVGSSSNRAQIFAIQRSLVRIEGAELELRRGGTDSGPLTDADAQALLELVGDKGWSELTWMAINISRHLTGPEKKL